MKKKTIFKRISVLLCAMIIGVGVLGGVNSYYAYDLGEDLEAGEAVFHVRAEYCDSSYSTPVILSDTIKNYKEYMVVYSLSYYNAGLGDLWYVVCSDSPISINTTSTHQNASRSTYTYDVDLNGCVCYTSYDGKSWEEANVLNMQIASVTLTDDVVTNKVSYIICGATNANCMDLLLIVDGHFLDEGVYNDSLGYLRVNSDKVEVLVDANGVQDLSTMRKKINFDSVSTTGVDLTTGEFIVRIYGQMAFQKNGSLQIINEDFPLVHYMDIDASNCSVMYNYQEMFDLVTESAENPYNAFDVAIGQIIRSDNVYYQIYNTTTGECSGYVKAYVGIAPSGAEETLYTTVDKDLNVDDSGYVGFDAPSSSGSGTTWEDAELDDEDTGSSNDDLEDFETTLNIFTSTLGSVPKAIGVVFSFLPDWCLGIIALSFAAFGIIAVFKFIRG